MSTQLHQITVAGGCFWGVEEYYKRLRGIVSTQVGYANGHNDGKVSYREVCTGQTGHAEATILEYNDEITLSAILDHLFRIIDPTSLNRQGNDIGSQYRTGIYFHDEKDLPVIESFIKERSAIINGNIVVEVQPLRNFVVAEPEHQDYLTVNPGGYCHVDFSVMKQDEMKAEYIR